MADAAHFSSRKALICLLLIINTATESKAQHTIRVPADQSTIQAGINAAANGDTVLVAPGIYVENIDFRGKAITVTSTTGPLNTIIDGSQGDIVVRFVTNETRASTINGFTIKNAGASLYPNRSPSVYFDGINVSYTTTNSVANPTITNNIITRNHGYGIEVHFGGALIRGNTISYTTTQYDPKLDFGCDYDDGNGIFIGGTPNDPAITTEISNNTIEHNIGHCLGGGIGFYAAGLPTVTNNIIRYNQSLGEGGGIYMVNGNAASIIQNLVYGNTSAGGGGGIYLGNSSPNLQMVNNTIVGNTISPDPQQIDFYEDGSQILFAGSVSGTIFFNNIIVAGDTYSAVACDPGRQYLSTTPLSVINSDILNFSGPMFGGWCVAPPTLTSATISADPQFVITAAGPFRLSLGSPAIDAGNNSAPNLPSLDLAGNARIQGNAIDLGVYEGPFAGISNAPPDYALSSTSPAITISKSQPGTVAVTVTPSGGFLGTLSFSCSGLPTGANCGFSPAKMAVGGDNAPISTNLTVTTSSGIAAVSVIGDPNVASASRNAAILLIAFLCAFISIAARNLPCSAAKSHRLLSFVVLLPVLMFAAVSNSCGGGNSNPSASAVPGPTPTPTPPSPVTSTIVITAAATGNTTSKSHTLNLALTVNP